MADYYTTVVHNFFFNGLETPIPGELGFSDIERFDDVENNRIHLRDLNDYNDLHVSQWIEARLGDEAIAKIRGICQHEESDDGSCEYVEELEEICSKKFFDPEFILKYLAPRGCTAVVIETQYSASYLTTDGYGVHIGAAKVTDNGIKAVYVGRESVLDLIK